MVSDSIDWKTTRSWLLLMVLSGLSAVKIGFFLPYGLTLDTYAYGSPLLALGSTVALASALLFSGSISSANKRGIDFCFALMIMLAIASHIPAERRIDSDESRMIATAQSIRLTGTAFAADGGIFRGDGTLIATSATLDKRGVFFPTQIAILDVALGPSHRHPFWLSWVSGLFALFLTARLARRLLPSALVPFAPLLFGVFPLFANHCRVGTFDVMNLAMILLLTHAAFSFWYSPNTRRMLLVYAASCALSQIRYESVALVAGICVCVMSITLFQARFSQLRAVALGAPWILIPAALRMVVPFDDLLPAPWFTAWSMENFRANIEHLLVFTITGGQNSMGNPWLALPCIFLILGLPIEWRRLQTHALARMKRFLLFVTTLAIPTLVILFYYWGKANLNFTARYFLPFASVLALGSLVSIATFIKDGRLRMASALAVSIFSVVWAIPRTKEAGTLRELGFAHRAKIVTAKLSGTQFQCDGLLVAHRGLVFTIHGFSSVSASELANEETATLASALTKRRLDISEDLFVSSDATLQAKLMKLSGGECDREVRKIEFGAAELHSD